MIRFTYYRGFTVKCFLGIGQCIIPGILRTLFFQSLEYSEPCQMSQMDLFVEILNCFQPLSSFQKSAYNRFDRVLNTPLEYTHTVYARISLWHWYGLMAFNKDLNEYQSLEKLIYCWIIYFQCWILTFKSTYKGTKCQKVSFYINETSILELMPKCVKSFRTYILHFRTMTDKLNCIITWLNFYTFKKARNEMNGACGLPLVNI